MAIVVFSNLITVLVLLDFALANVWSGQIALGADFLWVHLLYLRIVFLAHSPELTFGRALRF